MYHGLAHRHLLPPHFLMRPLLNGGTLGRPGMEAPIDVLRRAVHTERFDEDGDPIELEVLPPLTDEEVDEFRARLPCALPPHIRELLKFCRGFEGSAADAVDFLGEFPYAHDEIFPNGLPIASDGYGNFWVVDLNARSTDFGPVYFACHDPPVIAFQSSSLSGFLTDLLLPGDEETSAVNFVHEQATASIWEDDSVAVSRQEALSSTDSELRALAQQVPEGFFIADLRSVDVGAGFSWGKFGPDTRIVRHGIEPIFAYGPAK
jgi:SMI1 / KNR4 family (SUKH-1)